MSRFKAKPTDAIYKNIICYPEKYYDTGVQDAIRKSCDLESNQWIYNLNTAADETILFEDQHVVICKDKSSCHYRSVLVVFKDTRLKSMRDLRSQHIPMLLKAKELGLRFFQFENIGKPASVYFNYLPTVFQLHMHVSPVVNSICHVRSHQLRHVIRNLLKDDSYYTKALIMTRIPKNHCLFECYMSRDAAAGM